jgi:hypothetical protein
MNQVSLAETQCRSHIYAMSKDKKKSEPGDGTALGEWEAEGGSLISEPRREKQHIQLGEQEQYVLHCLGGAVLMQWNELPTNIQRVLFERAASLSKEDQTLALREQIARFLHNHKDD